ncbi:hypothetical protein A2344_02820 [Candidatus Peregrinibacteria bacterium RIFOXYB12_FULL_41_12]|nr:MAG: hypothetical protein A2244_05230 [Candidatus Peregrinibacteria bacterium RIFOXYA2_FULL_41_18]OGJ48923.1 MAG: hypothetical protein A2344_02820 [Candidatus Peregrinibacteria bacterium RIFOXYB12_FULL_41_12]OGJ51339.1 MAG: hypothetical protein A2336_05205 [Candidatus Peregrinibacteria bacterium RIFOXYB2_FULL_41_88]OGJ52744.1 MAG: hypothetical protein A2448_00990 [Candidatus Peregrinibacteria bacterium RIFOXYC2_FULL_41_22]
MKLHLNISKVLTGFVAGVVFMAAVGTTFAATSTVIPNFTAMKIGDTALVPSSGNLVVSGTGTFEGGLRSTAGVFTSYVKTGTLVPSASSISLVGSLSVSGSTTVTGGLTAGTMGSFYTVVANCASGTCPAYSYNADYNLVKTYCATGDYAVACLDSPVGLYYSQSWSNGGAECDTLSESDHIYAQAICFSPDGGTGQTGTTNISSGTITSSAFTNSLRTLTLDDMGVSTTIDSRLTDAVTTAVASYDFSPQISTALEANTDFTTLRAELAQAQTDIEEAKAFMGTLPTDQDGQLDLATYLDVNSYAQMTDLSTALSSYVRTSTLTTALSSYATRATVTALSTTVSDMSTTIETAFTSVINSISTLNTAVDGLSSTFSPTTLRSFSF